MPQNLIKSMASREIPSNYARLPQDQQIVIANQLAFAGQRGWYYDEFNQLIKAMSRSNGPMAEFSGLLRKLDNCPETYSYSTVGKGRYIVEKPYLALLGNTTPVNLRAHADEGGEFWNDGFWARFWFCCPPPDAWCTNTMKVEKVPVPFSITHSLRRWHEALGIPQATIRDSEDTPGRSEFFMDETLPEQAIELSQEVYDAYKRYREGLREITANNSSQDLDGNYVRMPNKALAAAALIASLEGKNRIDMPTWILAQEISERLRINLHRLYDQIASPEKEGDPYEEALIEYFKKIEAPTTIRDLVRGGPNKVRKLGSKGIEDLLKRLEKCEIVEMHKEGKKETWTLSQ